VSSNEIYATFDNRNFTAGVLADAQRLLGRSAVTQSQLLAGAAGVNNEDDLEQISLKLYRTAMNDEAKYADQAQQARRALAVLGMQSVEAAQAINEFCRNRGPGTADFAQILPTFLTSMPGMDSAVRRAHFQTLLAMADRPGSGTPGFIPQAEVGRIAQQILEAEGKNISRQLDLNNPSNAQSMSFSAELMEYLHQAHYRGNSSSVRAIYDSSPEGSRARIAAGKLLNISPKMAQQATRTGFPSGTNTSPALPSVTIVNGTVNDQ
jgi:hypothetical protein